MKEKIFYGIWSEVPGTVRHWVSLSRNIGLFTEHLCIVRGNFHNIKEKLSHSRNRNCYRIYQVGEDGLPTGEPLNE